MKNFYFLFAVITFVNVANAQIINFPDANFKAKLLASSTTNSIAQNMGLNNFKIDANSNGEIEVSEAQEVRQLNVSNAAISNLTGIGNFVNLQNLNVSNNSLTALDLTGLNLGNLNCSANSLSDLDVSAQTSMAWLTCSNNQLTALNLEGLNSLFILSCMANQLTSLDVSDNAINSLYCTSNQISDLNLTGQNIATLVCNDNLLTSIDVSAMSNLYYFYCNSNLLTSIDVSQNANLQNFGCNINMLTELNVNGLPNLQNVNCGGNPIEFLDFNDVPLLSILNCNDSPQLTTLFIKNGTNIAWLDNLHFEDCPNLKYICTDENNEVNDVLNLVDQYDYDGVSVNTYCSFVPGGIYNTLSGNSRFDSENDGCNLSDLALPVLKFNVTSGTATGNFFSDSQGNYDIFLLSGSHTVTPILENPYFTISPSIINVSFPMQTSPLTQDICVTANGIHNDIEVVVIPTLAARPGFDAEYKIIYRNKGTSPQSGSLAFQFDDALMDFLVATPAQSGQTTNNLTWDFLNLLPFETREVFLRFNMNSPMETPPLNQGDVLTFTASLATTETDETPADNVAEINQTVVNSFDPNDKTCLEGTTITPDMVGEYVHYIIRFENTGTFPAENIVVKDMIDLSKFDIATLIPLSGSHPFETRITSGSKVEFIFENIQLPFDDANNDGYVAFKIKTKPTLVVGDTFTNSASIYFDYNFPIVTNTATTIITALANPDFEFSNYFTLYPNPANTELNLKAKSSIEVKSINIYNLLGQLVLAIPNAQNVSSIDVSDLKSGNYFIKINSEKGSSSGKFMKQ